MQKGMIFIDSVGGGLASMGAAIALSYGVDDAIAATSSATISVPHEVDQVLAEIGLSGVVVERADQVSLDGARVIKLGGSDPDAWPVALHQGDGDLEKLATARIARDRIERHLSLIH